MAQFGSETSLYITFKRRVRTLWIENTVILNFSFEIWEWITKWQIKKIHLENNTMLIESYWQHWLQKGHKSKWLWVLYVIAPEINCTVPQLLFHNAESFADIG